MAGNRGWTASVVKGSSEPRIVFKRAYFGEKCGPILQTCAGRTLGPIDCKTFLSEHPVLPSKTNLSRLKGKRNKRKVVLRQRILALLSDPTHRSRTCKRHY